MNSIEKWSVDYKRLLTKKLIKEGIIINCVNCDNFDKPQEICKLASQRPPASVSVTGCIRWTDGLPF